MSRGSGTAARRDESDLCYLTATELSKRIRSRELSPMEVTTAVLRRIERQNPRLSAFITVTADVALAQAEAAEDRALGGMLFGPLDGIPYSLKDLEPTARIRTTFGSTAFRDNLPTEDGSVAARMKRTGAVLLGKTNVPHFGYKDMSDNLLGPPCANPWDLRLTAGGSSGGAAAAVAAGLGPLAHGTDGGGSIRIPAALCGVFGLKPTQGRVAYASSVDLWQARGQGGPLTRSVRDAAMMLAAIAGPDPGDPLSSHAPVDDYVSACAGDLRGLRVVWSPNLGYARVDREVRSITEGMARSFADFGCFIEERDPGWPDPAEFHSIIFDVGIANRVVDFAAAHPEWIEPTLNAMLERARSITAIDHGRALMARTTLFRKAREFFETCDLLLTPTMPVTAWSKEPGALEGPRVIDGRPTASMWDRLPFTFPFNLTGQPAAAVPCGFTAAGLPVSLQIVGRWLEESTVLRAAACFEAAHPWAGRRPELDLPSTAELPALGNEG